ncbi:MAG: large subunit ribosomal protein L24 [Parcubacteria group bacterium Gr01-1014_18]|nr:MAG: large subunit ribosomal protein L24 [Parcubacteria group bacterium Greene0416_36]TSC80263.1 MAG: large subunit ribosomal protein L24 [Parcubacteria group bacterium Gr01-1014_18]TSC98242.1 MAG: large subunit ribosomal protein L24 [Parcubacteria group bacterium Greene1014_20]TSD07015.1 MAG: large subunit ribosomal protein L24 [Parcubacteria group bacterium Greene0714_2]
MKDKVKIRVGKDKGKEGLIIQSFPVEGLVVVDGANKRTRHLKSKSNKKGENKGEKVEFFAPIRVSSVMLICPKCAKPTRIAYQLLETGKKVRNCKKCKQTID